MAPRYDAPGDNVPLLTAALFLTAGVLTVEVLAPIWIANAIYTAYKWNQNRNNGVAQKRFEAWQAAGKAVCKAARADYNRRINHN